MNIYLYEHPELNEFIFEKKCIENMGYIINFHDINKENWSAASLRPYFCNRKIEDWFNKNKIPQIKNHVDLERLTPQEALLMMVIDPSLIKYPLIRVKDVCFSGFDEKTLPELRRIFQLAKEKLIYSST